MTKPLMITLIVLAVLVVVCILLYRFGKKMQKKQLEQRKQMKEAAQMTSMLIIDKKMMKMKDAGLPKVVMEQTPKRYRNSKLPIVKAKVGPQTINLICDDGIFDELPTKCEVKAMVSGIYIVEIKSIRGKKKNKGAAEEPAKKSFGAKMRAKQRELQKEMEADEMSIKEKKAAKEEEKKKKERAKKITQ